MGGAEQTVLLGRPLVGVLGISWSFHHLQMLHQLLMLCLCCQTAP